MSASGVFIPPMLVFPRVRMKLELMDGTPPDTTYACHKSGWMQMDIFFTWFKNFLKHTSSSVDNPSLLILDGHATHTTNLEVIQLARAHGVTLLCLPPHCSHKLQPLKVAFMKPLSTFYDQECEKVASTTSRACNYYVPVGSHLWICIPQSCHAPCGTEWI